MAASVGDIQEPEIPEIAAFLARQVRAGEATIAHPLPPADRLRWLLLDNPARTADTPLGWRIRDDAGAVVGTAICTPFRVGSGSVVLTALMFSNFFVDAPFRGMGLGLLMRFVREGARFPLFCTSTNAVAGQLFQKVGGSLINGLDHTMLGVARPGPLVEEWLYRRGTGRLPAMLLALPARLSPGRIGRPPGKLAQAGELVPIANGGELDSLHLPAPQNMTAVVRDRSYLHWRYFTGERDKQVFRFRQAGEPDRLVVLNATRAGHRGQIRVLNVLDIWPPTDAGSAPVLAVQLAERYRGSFDTIWLRSQPVAAEESLRGVGFIRHAFPAPLGWYIDRENRLQDKTWYVMPGESE